MFDVRVLLPQHFLGGGDRRGALAARQLKRRAPYPPVSDPEMLPFLAGDAPRDIARDLFEHFILQESAHAAKLAECIEVADQRHVRIGRLLRIAVGLVELLRRAQQVHIRSNQERLE
jgi:hypothetical protein